MLETLREVREREYRKLWGKVPGTVGVLLWMLEVAMLGFTTGIWTGILTVFVLMVFTRLTRPDFRLARWFLDLAYTTVMRSIVMRILWLVLLVDLAVVQHHGWERLLALPQVALLFIAALILPFVMGRLLNRIPALAAKG